MPTLQTIADVLNDLLAAEQTSLFGPIASSMPHFGRGDVRRTIRYIATADIRRARDLWSLIEQLGLEHQRVARRPEMVGAYLSAAYILPSLIASKEQTLQRYRDAIANVAHATDEVGRLLRQHLTEHAGELALIGPSAAAP